MLIFLSQLEGASVPHTFKVEDLQEMIADRTCNRPRPAGLRLPALLGPAAAASNTRFKSEMGQKFDNLFDPKPNLENT
jgi:hypothetical protein